MSHEHRTILLFATMVGILFILVPHVLWAQRGEVVISTLAGGGSSRGDGDLATRARLLRPRGVAVDREGNVYIADSFDELVRRVGPEGIITTYAGGGQYQRSQRRQKSHQNADQAGLGFQRSGLHRRSGSGSNSTRGGRRLP